MFVTLALLLQVRLAKEQRLDTALLLGLVLAGGLLTKLTASIALYLIPLSALLFDFTAPRAALRLLRWLGALGLALTSAWGGYQVLKLSDFYDDLAAGREVLAQHGLGEALRQPWHWLAANWPTYQDALLGYLTVPLVVALVVGLAAGLHAHARFTLVLAGWSLLPLAAIVLLADFPYTRWLAVAVPPLAVLIAFGVLALVDAARRTRQGRHGGAAAALVAAIVLAPALVLDTRILATPETAPYPGDDLAAFVTGGSAGSVWDDVAADLRSRAAGRPVTVASGGLCCQSLALELSDDPNVTIVRADSDAAASALFAVENSVALPVREGDLGWQVARAFSRPRDGVPVTLYESGVRYGAALATSPDSLREAIGGTDADYDAFVSASTSVRAWLDAWYDAHPQDPTG
jgi:4-amino-4-deoxy-L-arabinose transferase-like glycosyltransferase